MQTISATTDVTATLHSGGVHVFGAAQTTREKMTLRVLYSRCEPFGDCMLWQQSMIHGSPQARINGKPSQMVRRYIFTEILGKRLRKGDKAVTKCGEPRCIAADCIVAKTSGEVLKRAYSDGKRSSVAEYHARATNRIKDGTAVLDFAKACAIRASDLPASKEAMKYGCSASAVRAVRRGDTWREGASGASVFTWKGVNK